ncbi:unnamed protein product [Parnassius apollo]|uniref:(apollo) hypothetical protein n=1 Tax=Parnassius apollo TaxID=110799 RepID=A0A8S3XYP5_PARAO|nr:unnamed protein product [Parnassius apollo]
MRCIDSNHSTFKQRPQSNLERSNNNSKLFNPKQVGDNKRLCQTIASGKETENKLLLQISEAEQVTDFERILNANAILWERGHVWRRSIAAHTPSASLLPRPRSTYSLHTVSQAYQQLFQQHEESVQPLVERYRQAADTNVTCTTPSLLEKNFYENLQDLSKFYEDDNDLQKEIETITDRLITVEVEVESQQSSARSKNFNVNLAGLIGLHVNGEGFSPTAREDQGPEIEKNTAYEGKEWLPSMSANFDERQQSNANSSSVDHLASNLESVQIDCDAKVPTITFTNYCDVRVKSDTPDNTNVVIHLPVPVIDSIDESRPPI